ncbi:hypothetical protein MF271_03535 [Deinococcus sp. KNUC1210]|uniref:hypothetical protein n=1 Tax=Deinococcus sp. KNUC1210 TaxID=2917691 RepID=UPI001EF110B1|nr:hypothetical protein [Deinococcus sp. KNUC1210]ULH15723.1 hypothetical protein MF271_03535 [Deinococcus sp. KNUC1210]
MKPNLTAVLNVYPKLRRAAPLLGVAAVLSASVLPGAAYAQAATPTLAKLPNLPISIMPSDTLQMLKDEGIQKAFPTGNRPEAVLLTADSKVTMSFEWRDTKLAPTDVPTMLNQFPAVIRAQVPGIKTLKQQMLNLNGNNWADFIFVAPGRSGDVRRELLITSAQGRMLVLTISSNLLDYTTKNETAVKALTGSMRIN